MRVVLLYSTHVTVQRVPSRFLYVDVDKTRFTQMQTMKWIEMVRLGPTSPERSTTFDSDKVRVLLA